MQALTSPGVFGTAALFALLVLLFIAALFLRFTGLQSHPYALGLPRHSLRAVIALAFTLLFGSLGFVAIDTAKQEEVTVFGPVQSKGEASTAAEAQIEARRKLGPKLAAAGETRGDEPRQVVSVSEPEEDGGNFIVYGTGSLVVDRANPDAIQMSREVLVIIATALSTIVGFYFGARSQASTYGPGDGSDAGDPARTAERLRVQGEMRTEIARLEGVANDTTKSKSTQIDAKKYIRQATDLLALKAGEFAEIELAMSAKKTEARIKALSALLTKMKAVT